MAEDRFIAYYRVSTAQQGRCGLLREFVEVESGKRGDRPELAKALATCRVHRAVLVIAKLDRLSRNAAFLLNLRDAGVEFVCADMPAANRLTVGIMALVAEEEARMISARTKAALAAAKVRGKALGGARAGAAERARGIGAKGTAALRAKADARAADMAPMIRAWQAAGVTSQAGL